MKTTAFLVLTLAVSHAMAATLETTARDIGKGEPCDYDPAWCEAGLSCVGNPGNMRCFPKKKLGMRCGQDPFWVCEEGLLCEYNICVKPPIGKGGACNDPDDVCEDGLSCVGNKGNMKCFAKKKLGMRCGQDPFWVCEDPYLCDYNICVKPRIGLGGKCDDPEDVCADHLSCVGNEGKKRCYPLRKLNRKCGHQYQVCKEGLVCKDGKCAAH